MVFMNQGSLIEVSAEIVKACYACFKCAGVCPVGLRPNMYVKAFLGSILKEYRDAYEEVLKDSSLWFCAKCLRCFEACPQKVPLSIIIEHLQNEAVKKGYVPQVYLSIAENIRSTYLAFASQVIMTRDGEVYTTEDARSQLGLQPLPQVESIEKFKKLIDEVILVE